MKKMKWVIPAAALLTLLACSDNDSGSEQDPPGKPTQVKVALTQTLSRPSSRAGTPTPTTEETEVKSATIYVFNGGQVLEKMVPVDILGGNLTEIFEATTGPHYFYAVVNGESLLPTFTEGVTRMSALESELILIWDIADLTTPVSSGDGFFMSSLNKAEPVELLENGPNQITLEVGRGSAKINLEINATPANQIGGMLSDVQYRTKVMPTEMFFAPNYVDGVFRTPYHFDPYDPMNYIENYDYVDEGTASYCVENSNWVPMKGNSNYIIIKGFFTPDVTVWKNADGTPNGVAPAKGTPFWRIANLDQNGNPIDYQPEYYSASPTVTIGPDQQIVHYPIGECYYPFWIYDPSVVEGDPAKYNVIRNNYYHISINLINGAGVPDEDDVVPDPDTELLQSTQLEATISIQDWSLIEIPGGI